MVFTLERQCALRCVCTAPGARRTLAVGAQEAAVHGGEHIERRGPSLTRANKEGQENTRLWWMEELPARQTGQAGPPPPPSNLHKTFWESMRRGKLGWSWLAPTPGVGVGGGGRGEGGGGCPSNPQAGPGDEAQHGAIADGPQRRETTRPAARTEGGPV